MRWWLFILLVISVVTASGQDKGKRIDKIKQKNIAQRMMGSVRRKPEADTVFNFKSEEAFLPYRGKIVRQILVERIGFERTVLDTAKTFKTFFAKAGNALHTTSREWVIRNNLFIKEGKPLNPYRLADNERYLRDLDFILDSRIFVYPVSPRSDSVDLLVVTRDVFSLGADVDPSGPEKYRFRVQNSNLLGMGQRLQYTGLVDANRTPPFGQELLYRKQNLFGTYLDGTIAYTQLNTGRSYGLENESAYLVRLNRPLFMPFARWAGGAELSKNFSENTYSAHDTLFARYTYHWQDYWAGYSFGDHHNQTDAFVENRHRIFVSSRYYQIHYSQYPQVRLSESAELVYSNRSAWLTQVTFFRQDFYKTKFIYGFGRTEDVPYGYSISITGGTEKTGGSQRPYLGLQGTKTIANRGGNFISFDTKLASYFTTNGLRDELISLTSSYFSKLYPLRKWSVRHFAEMNYSRIGNRDEKYPFDINNSNGLEGFRSDSLRGDARLRARIQAIIFTPVKLLGFNFALVPQFDYAFLASSRQSVFAGDFFQGYSIGLRSRNENLIFNTVEIRGYFFPKTVEGYDPVRVAITGNLRIKYPTSLVSPPSTVFGD